mmetsp:Transcript_57613/g.160507  ORF Transcript_57613/g.160507 Transcript_57613/m.160507 type:complete len:242 (+) Transcript_57613:1537-2262(+)
MRWRSGAMPHTCTTAQRSPTVTTSKSPREDSWGNNGRLRAKHFTVWSRKVGGGGNALDLKSATAAMKCAACICRDVRLSKLMRVEGPSSALADGAATARSLGALLLLLIAAQPSTPAPSWQLAPRCCARPCARLRLACCCCFLRCSAASASKPSLLASVKSMFHCGAPPPALQGSSSTLLLRGNASGNGGRARPFALQWAHAQFGRWRSVGSGGAAAASAMIRSVSRSARNCSAFAAAARR